MGLTELVLSSHANLNHTYSKITLNIESYIQAEILSRVWVQIKEKNQLLEADSNHTSPKQSMLQIITLWEPPKPIQPKMSAKQYTIL